MFLLNLSWILISTAQLRNNALRFGANQENKRGSLTQAVLLVEIGEGATL